MIELSELVRKLNYGATVESMNVEPVPTPGAYYAEPEGDFESSLGGLLPRDKDAYERAVLASLRDL